MLNSLGDGSVDVRHDDLIVPLPQVDVRRASLGPLELGRHRVHHLVLTRLQVQLLLQWVRTVKLVNSLVDIIDFSCFYSGSGHFNRLIVWLFSMGQDILNG